MGISFSNIGTVGREQLITSGSNGEPNWSYIPSKGKSTKKVNNRTYQFADEKTKKQIAYMSGYYLQTVPQSVKAAYLQQEKADFYCSGRSPYTQPGRLRFYCRFFHL